MEVVPFRRYLPLPSSGRLMLKMHEMCISDCMRCTSRAGEGIGVGVLSRSLAADKYLLLVCQSSGKEISASPSANFSRLRSSATVAGKLRTVRFAFFSAASISFTSFLPKPQEEVIRNLRPGSPAGSGPRCRGGCWDAVFPPYTMRRGCGMHRLSARRHSVRRGMISVEGCRGMHAPSPAGG